MYNTNNIILYYISNMLQECLMVSLIYGINPIMYKHSLELISVESFMIIFGLFYFVITLVFMYIFRHKLIKDIDLLRGNSYIYGVIFVSALLMFILGDYVFMIALKDNKSFIVTSIIASYPIFTVFLGYMLFNEEVKVTHFAGIMMVILGVLLLSR